MKPIAEDISDFEDYMKLYIGVFEIEQKVV